MTLWVTLSVCFASVGIALAMRGFFGTRVAERSLCRRCGFDLAGLFGNRIPALLCPECGADLNIASSIRRTRRQRWPKVIIVGCFALLVAAACGGTAIWRWYAALTPSTSADCVLYPQARWGSGTRQQRALQVLGSRIQEKTVAGWVRESLVAIALRGHPDPSFPWLKEWGDVVSSARIAGCLEDETWIRYVKEAVHASVQCRSTARMNSTGWMTFECRLTRAGQFVAPDEELEMRVGLLYPNAAKFVWWRGSEKFRLNQGSGRGSGGRPTFSGPAGCAPLYALVECRLTNKNGPRNPIAVWTVTATTYVDVVPESQPVVQPLNDPSLQAIVEESIAIDKIDLVRQRQEPEWLMTGFDYSIKAIGIPLAFELLLRTRDSENPREIPWTFISCDGLKDAKSLHFTSAEDPGCDRVDVILRPSIRAAEETTELSLIWMGEDIVIRDVKVQPEDAPSPLERQRNYPLTKPRVPRAK